MSGTVFSFLTTPSACGCSQARDPTHDTAATRDTAVTAWDPQPAVPQGNFLSSTILHASDMQ